MARTLTWTLLILLVAPAVAAGVDLVDRSGDGIAFTVPPLAVGAHASYDLAVVSDFTGTMNAPGAVHVEVTGNEHGDTSHHSVPASFTYRTVVSPTPWDHDQGRLAPSYGAPVDAARERVVTEIVRAADGRVVHRIDDQTDDRWMERDDDVVVDTATRYREHHLPVQAGPWEALRQHLSNRYVYEDPLIDDLTADRDDDVRVQRAELDGQTVYGWSRTHVHDAQEGQGIGCHLAFPEYMYSELSTMGGFVRKNIWLEGVETTWVSPDNTFPLLTVCETVYRVGGPDGEELGSIRFMARLAAWHGGDGAIPLKEPPGDMEQLQTMAASARHDNGLPSDEPSLFRLTLDAAYQSLLESGDETIVTFRSEAEPPFIVLTATYDPDHSEKARCDLGPVPCEPLGPVRETARNAVPSWTFLLQNEYNEHLKVRVIRQVTPAGEGLPPEIYDAGYVHSEPVAVLPGHVPRDLVPPSDVLERWLDATGITLEQWRADAKGWFEIGYQPQGDLVVPYYTAHADLETIYGDDENGILKHDGGPNWTGTFYHRYRGDDGVLLENGMDSTDTTTAPPPKHETSSIVYDAGLSPHEHVPVAGLVVGGITLAGLATALRTGLPDWFRRALWFPLFTKLTKDQVLDHKTRDEMISYVASNPGVGTEEIRKHFQIGWGTAVYHLSALEQNRLLTSLRTGGHRHWFPAHAMDPRTKQVFAMLRSPAAKRLYEAVAEAPGRTQQEIAEVLGVTHGAVIFQVRKLERAGLIRKERDGRFVRYFAEVVPTGPAAGPSSARTD